MVSKEFHNSYCVKIKFLFVLSYSFLSFLFFLEDERNETKNDVLVVTGYNHLTSRIILDSRKHKSTSYIYYFKEKFTSTFLMNSGISDRRDSSKQME